MSKRKKNIVFIGNAQANQLHSTWLANVPGVGDYQSIFVHYQHISHAERKSIEGAAVAVVQISDIATFDVAMVNSEATIIRFPYVNGAFLWPHAGVTHPNWGSTAMHECGVFAGEAGDGFLARMFKSGVSSDEAVHRYIELDVIKAASIRRRYEMALNTQRLRDEKAGPDFAIADYIDQNLNQKSLFLSRQALAKPMLWKLARPIFQRIIDVLGEDQGKIDDAERQFYQPLYGLLEIPIHPQIANHFCLPGRSEEYMYRVNRSRMTFDRYARDYMNQVYQVDIYAGIRMVENLDFADAVSALERGLTADPASPYAADALSQAFLNLDRIDDALAMALAAVRSDPSDRDFHISLSNIYVRKHMGPAAVATLARALEIHPHHLGAHLKLSDLLNEQGQRAQAIDLAERLAEDLQHTPHVHVRLGLLKLENNDLLGAEIAFRSAIKLDDMDFGVAFQLADVLVQLNRPDEAIAELRSLTLLYPDDASSNYFLGHIYWRVGRLDEAEQHFRIALTISENNAEYDFARKYHQDEGTYWLEDATRSVRSGSKNHFTETPTV